MEKAFPTRNWKQAYDGFKAAGQAQPVTMLDDIDELSEDEA